MLLFGIWFPIGWAPFRFVTLYITCDCVWMTTKWKVNLSIMDRFKWIGKPIFFHYKGLTFVLEMIWLTMFFFGKRFPITWAPFRFVFCFITCDFVEMIKKWKVNLSIVDIFKWIGKPIFFHYKGLTFVLETIWLTILLFGNSFPIG